MAKVQTRRPSRQAPPLTFDLDRALIVLFIGAMDANRHVAPGEAARAQHLIWSSRRFRRKSGETVGKLIQDMRAQYEQGDADAVMDAAVTAIPARLRPPTFAVVADLLLADGKMEPRERRFLDRLGSKLEIEPETVRQVVEVILIKNQL
jgi:tellurite resistance protein